MKNKIVIICPFFSPNIGGVESHLDQLVEYLVSLNKQIEVLTYRPLTTLVKSYKTLEKSKNLAIHRYPMWGFGIFDKTTKYPFLQFLYIVPPLLLYSIFFFNKNHKNIEIVHTHGFAATFIGMILKFIFPQFKFISSTHYIYPSTNIILKYAFNHSHKILCASLESKNQMIKIGINSTKIKIFKHWLNEKTYYPQKKDYCISKLHLPKNKNIILYIGRIIKSKGIFQLEKAAKKLIDNKIFLFIIIGDGPDLYQLKKTSNFLLIGKKNAHEINDYLGASDIIIIPSISPEAQPRTIVESLACNRPIIVTNLGSAKDMVNKNISIVIKPNSENIIKTIIALFSNKNKLKEMKKNTIDFYLKNFSQENAKIIIETYYES